MSAASQVERVTSQLPQARLGRVSLRDLFGKAAGQAIDDDLLGIAAELAYRATLAVLPFLLMLAALPSVAGSVFSIQDIGERFSREAGTLVSKNSEVMVRALIEEVAKTRGWTPLLVGLVGVLWAGTSATSALRKSLNRIYKFDDETPFVERKIREFALTIGAGLLLFTALVLILLGPALMGGWSVAGEILCLGLAFVLVLTAVSLLYWLAPSGENAFRWVTPGALVFGGSWLVFSLAFSAYLSRFGSLNHVYGSLGAMIALLVWLYGSNAALLFGAELNSVIGEQFDPKVQESSVRESGT